ncbi:hypothetical protein [Aliarcobacter butzleri]
MISPKSKFPLNSAFALKPYKEAVSYPIVAYPFKYPAFPTYLV